MNDFTMFMNPPECPVQIGKEYKRTDLLLDDNVLYKVINVFTKEGKRGSKFYAHCSYESKFDGQICFEDIYAFNLEEVQDEA